MRKYPVYEPSLGEEERALLLEAYDSGWISSKGSMLKVFEESFSSFVGAHSTSCSNGTVALHLALEALGIGPGDEVIIPSLTYIATANAVRYCGAVPIFVDSDPSDWNISTQAIEAAISANTKAVLIVHLYGCVCDINTIKNLCQRNSIFLVEDCAEAFGSYASNRHVGTFGDISTFSFFGNKTITTGEGGMVSSTSLELIEKVRKLKNQGLSSHREYWHDVVGFNYRMTNLQAAIGVAQLRKAKTILAKKITIFKEYQKELKGFLEFQHEAPSTISSRWMVVGLINESKSVQILRAELAERGIETRPVFPLISEMPPYLKNRIDTCYPVATVISRRGVNLPSSAQLNTDDVKYISSIVKELLV